MLTAAAFPSRRRLSGLVSTHLFPHSSSWTRAVSSAEQLVSYGGSVINPRELLGSDLALLTQNIKRMLGSGHPVLTTISSYYFSASGKHIRPLLVLLMSQATNKPLAVPKNTLVDQCLDSHSAISFETAGTQLDASCVLPSQRYLNQALTMQPSGRNHRNDPYSLAAARRRD